MPLFDFFKGKGSWRGYKATSAMLFVALVETFVDNYWLFTGLPMAGNNPADNDPTTKFFYFVAQLAVNSAKDGGIGLAIDYLRSIYQQNNSAPDESFTLVR